MNRLLLILCVFGIFFLAAAQGLIYHQNSVRMTRLEQSISALNSQIKSGFLASIPANGVVGSKGGK